MYTGFADYSKYGFHRTIKYKGVFDFDGLYKFIAKWIKDHDFDFYETKIWDYPPYKIHKMVGKKKINFYAMLLILPEIWLWEAKPVEVLRDGHLKHLTEARMKIIINGGFILDYDGDFEKAPGLKKLEKFLVTKIMYHEVLLKYFDYLDYYLYDFMTDVKKFLDMETDTKDY